MNIVKIILVISLSGNLLLFADPSIDLLNSASQGNLAEIKKSLSKKADIHFKDNAGKNALMYAAESGDFPVVEFLVENGADVIAKARYGETASFFAKQKGNATIQNYLENKETEVQSSQATAIITFIAGEVYEGNRKLKIGDTVLENKTIYVRKKSVCDLQIKEPKTSITVRLKENSVFTLKHQKIEDKNVYSAFLKYGGALFKVGKLENTEKLKTLTPTLVAAVRGTVYEVTMDEEYNTSLDTYEGSVQARVHAEEAETNTRVSRDPNIQSLLQKLDSNSQLVEKGKSLRLTKIRHDEILSKTKAGKSYERAIRGEVLEPEESFALTDSEKPEISELKKIDIKAKLQEADDMIIVNPDQLKETVETPEVISILKKQQEEKIIETFRPETLKAAETMKLKNGKKIQGSIYQIGTKYIVFSSIGKKSIYEKSEVEGFVYE